MEKKACIILLASIIILVSFSLIKNSEAQLFNSSQDQAINAFININKAIENKSLNVPYSGAYINENNILVVGLTDLNPVFINAIKAIAGKNPIIFEKREFTFDEVWYIYNQIRDEVLQIPSVTGIGIDEKVNKISIGLDDTDESEIVIQILNALDVPSSIIIFEQANTPRPVSRFDRHRPLMGAIAVQSASNINPNGKHSLGFSAIDNQGNRGIVVSGHAVTGTNDHIYQPEFSSNNYINKVTRDPQGARYSDAAWVPTTQVQGFIYRYLGVHGWVSQNNTPVGMIVTRHGISSGTGNGKILRRYHTQDSKKYGTLYDQVRVEIRSWDGDSGGPFTNATDESNVSILGITVSADDGYGWTYYSPMDGIRQDLNINRPLWYNE